MMGPGWFDRSTALRRLAEDDFDVLVVGGGITGSGCALDAASRGLRTALVERDDFASGTSSKSSKMVHGGLRYLQNGEFRLVYEALHERQRLRTNAPHLVKTLPFLLPVLTGADSPVPRKLARAMGSAMWIYDLTGGARIGKIHERLEAAEALKHFPTLPAERLAAAYLYYDARADDARLTLTLARTASIDHGAVVANGVRLVRVNKDVRGRVNGARVEADGVEIDVSCRAIINATGVWADDVRALDEGTHPHSIRPAKGIHITVPWSKIRNDIAAVIPVPKDKRSIFVVPWYDTADPGGDPQVTYLGTTDTDYDGPVDDPQCTAADVRYILDAANASISTGLTEADVLGTWAGLRPLVRSAESEKTADLSRRHRVQVSDSGVITITGGKLTTYREMAADTVDDIVAYLGDEVGARAGRCRTARLPLRGAEGWEAVRTGGPGAAPVSNAVVEHLTDRYGSEARTLLAMTEGDASLAEPLVRGLPYLRAEAVFAARYEMARSVDDVLSRRTRARLLARDASAEAAQEVADLIAPVLGLSDAEASAQVARYHELIDAERSAPGLPETSLEASLGA
jgi:glycerol-3-phosphate dehydrogenase